MTVKLKNFIFTAYKMIKIETNSRSGTKLSCVINKYPQPIGGHWFACVKNQMCYSLSIKQNQFGLLGIVTTLNMVSKTVILKSDRGQIQKS